VIGQTGEQESHRTQITDRVGEGHSFGQDPGAANGREFLIRYDHDEAPLVVQREGRATTPSRESARATTSPPSNDAAAFSACPSILVLMARGSLAPAATAAATVNAAEEPKPRESGICDVTCIAKFECPRTSAMTGRRDCVRRRIHRRRNLARDGEGVRRLDGDFEIER